MCKFSKLKQPLFGSFQGKPAAAKSLQSCPTLCDPWTVACQALRFKGFYRQEYMGKKKKKEYKKEYWSGLPGPPPRDLSDPGTEPTSLTSPASPGTKVSLVVAKGVNIELNDLLFFTFIISFGLAY